jgi:hypothetical protein
VVNEEFVIDDFEFISADQLAECLQNWTTSPDISGIVYVEDGQGNTMKRVVLLGKRLSDGSMVYNARLS